MNYDQFHTKRIEVSTSGNTAYATIIGTIPPAYFVQSIDVSRNEYCSEIVINLGKTNADGMISTQVMHKIKQHINLGSFTPGKFCARINKRNDFVEWFEIR